MITPERVLMMRQTSFMLDEQARKTVLELLDEIVNLRNDLTIWRDNAAKAEEREAVALAEVERLKQDVQFVEAGLKVCHDKEIDLLTKIERLTAEIEGMTEIVRARGIALEHGDEIRKDALKRAEALQAALLEAKRLATDESKDTSMRVILVENCVNRTLGVGGYFVKPEVEGGAK